MDIFNLTFTGNLTDNAVKRQFKELGKEVINFTVASNIDKKTTIFLKCEYWLKMKEEPKSQNEANASEFNGEALPKEVQSTLIEHLTKGKGVTVTSNRAVQNKYENTNDGKVHEYLSISVVNLVFKK